MLGTVIGVVLFLLIIFWTILFFKYKKQLNKLKEEYNEGENKSRQGECQDGIGKSGRARNLKKPKLLSTGASQPKGRSILQSKRVKQSKQDSSSNRKPGIKRRLFKRRK